MFDWLFEGHLTVYALLALAAVALLAVWWRRRKPVYLLGAVAMLVLIGVYWVLDRAVETDREQIIRKVREMAAGVRDRNLDAVFKDVSDQFTSPLKRNKGETRALARDMIESNRLSDVTVWDFRFNGPVDRAKGLAEVSFQFKPKGNVEGDTKGAWFRCEATFALEGDHGWRLRECQIFPLNQIGGSNAIPAF